MSRLVRELPRRSVTEREIALPSGGRARSGGRLPQGRTGGPVARPATGHRPPNHRLCRSSPRCAAQLRRAEYVEPPPARVKEDAVSNARSESVTPVPEHLHTVTPRLVVRDGAAAIAFY